MKEPLISIITVVLNSVSTIENTFRSVFTQNFRDYEYIVIDGRSTDGTLDIIRQYESDISYWKSEPDEGIYDAMNKATDVAKGKWLYFLGADDLMYNILDDVATQLIDEQTVYYGDVYRPKINRRYDGKFSALKLASRNICHQSIFYPKEIMINNAYNLKYPIMADYELNMRCFADQHIILKYIPITISLHNDIDGVSQQLTDVVFQADRMMLIKKYFSNKVYLVATTRFLFIKSLSILKLDKLALFIHHSCLRQLRKFTDTSIDK